MTLHIVHRYLLSTATARGLEPSPSILEYGCGTGEIVEVGRQAGLEIFGVDTYSTLPSALAHVQHKGWLGSVVRDIQHGAIPFESDRFDAVISNQVLDHVSDLDQVLREVHRVLKPGGSFLCSFPVREGFREGKVGIPFIHWFPRNSRLRFAYALTLRALGFGYFKDHRSRRAWTRDALHWIDHRTCYRSRDAIEQSFARWFTVSLEEPDYLDFRLSELGWKRVGRLLRHPFLRPLVREVVHRLGSPVILAQKPVRAPQSATAPELIRLSQLAV